MKYGEMVDYPRKDDDRQINLVSMNVNGARSDEKQSWIVDTLKGDVICLQETHWTSEKEDRMRTL